MATIQSTIELHDSFSPVLNNVMDAVNLTIASVEHMQQSLGANMDVTSLNGAVESIHQAGAAMAALNEQMANRSNTNINIPTPQPVEVPVHWQVDNMEVFTSTGIERFEQETHSANAMMRVLSQRQSEITARAGSMDILPPQASQDMMNLQNRIQTIQTRIMEISANPVNIGTEQANAELERLRTQLSSAIDAQNDLNSAVARMDVSSANAAYLRLSNTVGNTEQYIRDNVNEQGRFNQQIRDGTVASNGLLNSVKRVAGAYLGIQGAEKVLGLSDTMASTNARLELLNEMNGSLRTQQELQDAVFAAAERSRGKYSEMASTVAKLGIQASKAFSGTDEITAFTELLNKSFVNGGASATEQTAAMYQLTQAMAAGKLQGDEYRSIIENAPQLATAIEDYMINVQHAEGSMKEWASEGMLTADVIKAALFSSADEINERFEKMPMTFGQIWNSIVNRANRAFRPFLQRLNDMANSDRFNSMVDGAIGALAVLGAAATEVIDLMVSGAAFIHDNWAFIGPIVYGVAFAVGVYTAAVAFNSIALKINNAIKRIATIRSAAHGEAIAAERLATLGMTAAQLKLNVAMYACPVTWILVIIFAIIAAIYIVTAVINKVCDTSISATGMIVGALYVIRAAFINIGLFIDNVFFGIMNVLDVVLSACGNGFINFGLLVDNTALGIWEVIKAIAENIVTAFENAINNSKAIFYGLAAVAFDVISRIAEALNKLPFIEFDVAGLDAEAAKYAAKSIEAANDISNDYTSISDAWSKGFNTYDYLNTGSLSDIADAWNKGYNTYEYLNLDNEFDLGYAAGENLANKLKSIFNPKEKEDDEKDKTKDYQGLLNALEGINNNTGATAGNTADIKDALEITDEDLKYLRDIAEREVIDRTVLKSVTIDMSGMTNKVENMQDLDGISTYLAKSLRQQMEVSMEGA